MNDHAPASPSGTLHTLTVEASQAGMRLDRWLADRLPALSRSRLQALIAAGQLILGGAAIVEASRKVKALESFTLLVPPALPALPTPQDLGLTIVFEDQDLIVIDKPAGLVVHPAPGNPDRTLVNALLHHCPDSLSGIGGVKRPGIVHRIDKDTSGLLVAAKNDRAHQGLAAQFAAHSIERAYLALCWGVPLPRNGRIAGNIGRHPVDRKRMAVIEGGGKHALTFYRVETAFGSLASLVECRLATGRTHQIRVHMTAIGHPLIGDPLYRRSGRNHLPESPAHRAALQFARQALHAKILGFCHPTTGIQLRFESQLPSDFIGLINSLEGI